MVKKTYCFDIDNTICKTTKNFYNISKPYKEKIKAVNRLYNNGNKIIFFTSRGMSKYKGNKTIIKKTYYNFTINQLKKWNVKFHKLILGKPSYDLIIDDKSIFYKRNWENYLK